MTRLHFELTIDDDDEPEPVEPDQSAEPETPVEPAEPIGPMWGGMDDFAPLPPTW